ncbi:high mobility group A5 [Actinidia rufa]|uniref:High mobility group A5 n=1 Tax=Actinidia rufa TaxID=165716 RepID=A0A7J0H1V8_9ERIC|nr:high mobility group A5 [Actinidia rufa]
MKHSYKLARSFPLAWTAGTGYGNASSSMPKIVPGRPPKPKVDARPHSVGVGLESASVSLGRVDVIVPVAKRGPEDHLCYEMKIKNLICFEKWTTFCKK